MIQRSSISTALEPSKVKRHPKTLTIRQVHNVKHRFIKVGHNNWVPLHRHRWEMRHGKVPAGSVITFKNGNTLDCSYDNLICLTLNEFVRTVKKGKKGGQKALLDIKRKQNTRLITIDAELQAKTKKLTSIDAELEEYRITDFPGRVETNDTKIKKMKRLQLLKEIEALNTEKLSITKTHKTNVHNS